MARTQGSVSTFDNTEVKALIFPLREVSYNAEWFHHYVPPWLENCLRGASGQMRGTSRPSTYRIFKILACLNDINTTTVGEFLNKKRRAIEGKEYSYSYINQWVKCLRCAAQAIQHHKPAEGLGNLKGVCGTPPKPQVSYTEEQKEHMRYLAVEGKLDELSDYVRGIQDESL